MFLATILCFSLLIFFPTIVIADKQPKLLVVSYDAFRWDYFDRNVTPFMNKLRKDGTYVDYMKNVFVTKTLPNHHSIATGFYVETHGVIDNEMLNKEGKTEKGPSYELYHYNDNVLPIWTVNEKSGHNSGAMMWPGSSYKYQNVTPTFTQEFNQSVPWKERVNTVISWFNDPVKPINFGVLYIEEPDFHGHGVGIHSTAFNNVLSELDKLTEYLHDKLAISNLQDVNVIHLSDHGMAGVTLDRVINLTKYINNSDYTATGTNPLMQIYPNPGKEQMIYDQLSAAANELKTFLVYKRDEIPERYHYKNPRIGAIFVIAKVGYGLPSLLNSIDFYKKRFNITVNNETEFGVHGYDNEASQMHPFFFAKGPAFLPNCHAEPFDNIQLYPLFCKILKVDCPTVNGTLGSIEKCLTKPSSSGTSTSDDFTVLHVTVVLLAFGFVAGLGFLLVRRRKRANSNYSLVADNEAEQFWDENHDFEALCQQHIRLSYDRVSNINT